VNAISPVNLLESVPPKVSSPFSISNKVVGSNEIATRLSGIFPCLNKLSVTLHSALIFRRSQGRRKMATHVGISMSWSGNNVL
jgi:hypothetical protein